MDTNLLAYLDKRFDEQRNALQAMRVEAKEDHDRLEVKVDNGMLTLNNHETRLVTVENTRRTGLWIIGAVILALLTAGGDIIANHFSKGF